jgi:hypothetical protein
MEYVMVAGMLVFVVLMISVFLYTFRQFGGRVLDLAGMEYP